MMTSVSRIVLAGILGLALAATGLASGNLDLNRGISADFHQIDQWLKNNVDTDDAEPNMKEAERHYEDVRNSGDKDLIESWRRFLDLATKSDECSTMAVEILEYNIAKSGITMRRGVLGFAVTRVGKIVTQYVDSHARKCAKFYTDLYEKAIGGIRDDVKLLGDIAQVHLEQYIDSQDKTMLVFDAYLIRELTENPDTWMNARAIIGGIRGSELFSKLTSIQEADGEKQLNESELKNLVEMIVKKCETHSKATESVIVGHLDSDLFVGNKLSCDRFSPLEGWLISSFCKPLIEHFEQADLIQFMRYLIM